MVGDLENGTNYEDLYEKVIIEKKFFLYSYFYNQSLNIISQKKMPELVVCNFLGFTC
jgi:hypothetical protein